MCWRAEQCPPQQPGPWEPGGTGHKPTCPAWSLAFHMGRFLASSPSRLRSQMCLASLDVFPKSHRDPCPNTSLVHVNRELSSQTASHHASPGALPGSCSGKRLAPRGGAGFWAWEAGAGRGGRAPRRCGKLAIRHGKKGAVPNPRAPLQLFKASTPVVRERRGEGGELQFPQEVGKGEGRNVISRKWSRWTEVS